MSEKYKEKVEWGREENERGKFRKYYGLRKKNLSVELGDMKLEGEGRNKTRKT